MRKMTKPLALLLIVGLAITSCKKEVKETPQDEIPQEILSKISSHGFGTSNVQKDEDGYLVEGDIILTEEFLNSTPGGHYLRIAETEQYRTTNLVSGLPRTITVSASGTFNSNVSSAIDGAIARYNAENLMIDMVRVASGGEINIKIVNGGNYIASAGFPSGGDPYGTVKFNRQYQNWPLNTVTTVMAHEIGHCIGFRHTDYMNRSFSCGGSPVNEGSAGVGAIHIPSTPTGPDSGSWMLSCLGSNSNRPFNNNDKVALNHLY